MVVGRKEGLSSDVLMDIFDDGLSKSHPVISCSSTSQFIKENERVLGRMRNGIIGLHHLHHKGRLTRNQVICCSDTGKNRIKNR
ncbi:Uncharacterised protein [Streptococcus pneumoniae]|nr:Uncharacterised protein [Streptococcus pneumoniae]